VSDQVQMNVRVPRHVRDAARRAADAQGTTVQEFTADALAERSVQEPGPGRLSEMLAQRIEEQEAELDALYRTVAERVEAEGGDSDPLTADEADRADELRSNIDACRARQKQIAADFGSRTGPPPPPSTRPHPAAPAPRDSHPVEEARLSRYVAVASAGRGVIEGAEAELNQELGLPSTGPQGGVVIPAVVVAASAAGRARLSRAPELADLSPAERARAIDEALRSTGGADRAVTTTQSASPSTASLAGRVFAPSAVAELGVTPVMATFGQREIDVISAGSTPAWQSESPSDEYTPAAATLDTTTMSMTRLIAAYDLSQELQVRLGGGLADGMDIDSALSMDMMAATDDVVHGTVINGSGTAPVPEGIWAAAPPSTEPDDPAAKSTAAQIAALFSGAYDGVYAGQPSDVKLITSPGALGALSALVWDTGSGVSIVEWAARNFGGIVASSKIGVDKNGSDLVANGVFALGVMGREFDSALATWNAYELVRDYTTDVRKGLIRLTQTTGMAFAVLRTGAFTRNAKVRY